MIPSSAVGVINVLASAANMLEAAEALLNSRIIHVACHVVARRVTVTP